jgi:hypothetical protein
MTTITRTPVRTRILTYFNQDTSRTLSTAQAQKYFKIKNVSARISELRADGYDIRTTMKPGRDGVERAVYNLVPVTKSRRRAGTSTSG